MKCGEYSKLDPISLGTMINKFWVAAFILISSLLVATAGHAATYYVAKTGSDSHACSQAQSESTPKLTIGAGVRCMSGGDTLFIKQGIYAEGHFSITPPPGTASAYTTIRRHGTDVVSLTCNPFKTFNSTTGYLIVDGFIIDGGTCGTQSGVVIGQGPHHIRVINTEIRNFAEQGIMVGVDSLGGNEFINLDVHDNGSTGYHHGLYIESSNNLVEYSKIYRNAGNGAKFYRSGCDTCANNNIARYNVIYDNDRARMGGTYGFLLASGSNNVAHNNISYNNHIGIGVQRGALNSRVYNNISFNNTNNGFYISGQDGPTNNTMLYNNTAYNNAHYGIFIGFGATNTIVKNNISHANRAGDIYAQPGQAPGAVLSHNLTTDPGFVNALTNDFRLKSTSPAIDTGVVLGEVSIDFDGVLRPQGRGYDIGAYEYNSSQPSPGSPPAPPSNLTLSP